MLGLLKNKLSQLAHKPDLPHTSALYALYLDKYMRDLPERMRLEQQIRLLERDEYAYAVA